MNIDHVWTDTILNKEAKITYIIRKTDIESWWEYQDNGDTFNSTKALDLTMEIKPLRMET